VRIECQEAQETRRGRQHLDAMRRDQIQHRVRVATPGDDELAPVRQGIEQGVQSRDVIQQQEGQRPHPATGPVELVQEAFDALQRGLRPSR
jgi:hypothetical protein